uniref:Ubiquitin-like domain-containing protein n=1 Tax=Scylla olivacea TaxID=85551 RepID=A0A0P4WB88_SCYOL
MPVVNLDGASSSSEDEKEPVPVQTPTKQKQQPEHITLSPDKMSRGIMSDSSDSDTESNHITVSPSPAPRVPPHWNNSGSDNSDDIFNIDYSSHNHQALKGAYKELIVTEGQRNKTWQSTTIQSLASESDDDCRIVDHSSTPKTRQKKEDIIECPPSPTLFEIDKNNQKEESCRTTRRTRGKNRIAELERVAKRQRTSVCSPHINDSLFNISSDIVTDEEEEDVNPEIRLRIKWGLENFWLPIRKLQKFSHLYEVLAEKYDVSADRVVLNFNDKIINPALCPADLNINIGDIIEGGVASYTSFSHPPAPQPITQDADSISLRVQNSKKKGSVTIIMSLKEKMSVLMHKYAEEKQLKLNKLRFMFDGELLSANSTPSSLDLEGGECIDVYECS